MTNFKITRAAQKIFAGNSASDELAAFGTMQTGTPIYTNNVEALQNLYYEGGWARAVVNNNAPFLEEMNAVQYGFSYQLAYLLQNGIPEYSEAETYFTNNYCQYNGFIYKSQSDENVGNNPADDDGTNWTICNFMEIATDAQATAGLLENVAINPKQLEAVKSDLQTQIDTITASSDVTDIVGTYSQLQAYDTSSLQNNDIVKVLQDEEHENETTYYRWVITDGAGEWSLIGEEGPYYTISSANNTFVSKNQYATNRTVGIIQVGNGLDVDDSGVVSVNIEDLNTADTSLSNLSAAGNSRLQHAPFSINSGEVVNGINSTLYAGAINVNISGALTNNQGVLTGFSTSDYAALPNIFNPGNNPWEFAFKFSTGADVTTRQYICGSNRSVNFIIFEGQLRFSLGDGTSINIVSEQDVMALNPSVNYEVNLTFNGSQYVLTLNNDSVKTFTSSALVAPNSSLPQFLIGINPAKTTSFSGSFDLTQSYININNERFWTGASQNLTALQCAPCTITTADGRTKEFEESAVLDCSDFADGKYKVFRDIEGKFSITSNLTVSKTTPENPLNGDYWLDYSQTPLALKKYYEGNWVIDNDKVYLGNVIVSSNTIQSVFNVDFNAVREGDWINSEHLIYSGASFTAYREFDLSSYLPDDGFNYDVIFSGFTWTAATANKRAYIQIGSDIQQWRYVAATKTENNVTSLSGGSADIAVGAKRFLYQPLISQDNSGTSNSWSVTSYRRIGII